MKKERTQTRVSQPFLVENSEPDSLKTLIQMMILLVNDYASLSVETLNTIKRLFQEHDLTSVVQLLVSHNVQVSQKTQS